MWLELNKVRQLPPEQREPLKDTTAAQWQQTLTRYLSQVFPSPSQAALATSTSPLVVADALLRYAVAVEYTDKADEYNSRAKQHKPAVSATVLQQQRSQQLPFYSEADIRAGLIFLTTVLSLPNPDSFQPPLTTHQLLVSLTSLLSLHLNLPSNPTTTNPTPTMSPSAALSFIRQLPVPPADQQALAGMEQRVVVLAAVLRLLSVWRLREVQERVTECLHGVQKQMRVGKRAGRVDMKKGEVGR